MNPKISFIIPCYNVEGYVQRCINSVYDQNLEYSDFEVIVINDGSTDGTLDILRQIKYDNYKIINQDNCGLSGARNRGLIECRGNFIWFIDSDDYIIPNITNHLLEQVNKDNLDILFFSMQEIHPDKKIIKYHHELENDIVLSGEDAILNNYQPNSACAAIYRKEFLRKNSDLKFYEKLYHQDVEFNYRATALAKRIKFIKEAPYIYEIHPNSISQSKDQNKIIKRLTDNSIIAKSFKIFSKKINNQKVAKRIRQQSTSIILGTLLSLRDVNSNIRKKVIRVMKENETFPVRSDYKSIKQRILILLLNYKYSKY